MAGSKETKEILKQPDEFITLSARAIHWARQNTKILSYTGASVAAAVLIFVAANAYVGYADRKGQDAYNKAYNALGSPFGEKSKDDLTGAASLFEEVIKEHGFSGASRLALAQLASLRFGEKRFDDAISLYKTFMEKAAGESRYVALTKLSLAACYEAKGQFNEAVALLQSILDQPLVGEAALWNLARLYRLSNEGEKEKEMLKKFAESYPDSPFLPLAKSRI